ASFALIDAVGRTADTTTIQEQGGSFFMRNDIQNLSRFIGHDVVDRNGNQVGTLECLWSDHTGQPAFIGVKTGWFLSKTHVVPAQRAEINEAARVIRLPYEEDRIKQAPSYEANMELNEGI